MVRNLGLYWALVIISWVMVKKWLEILLRTGYKLGHVEAITSGKSRVMLC